MKIKEIGLLLFFVLIPFLLFGQNTANRDTAFFSLKTKMIKNAKIHKIELKRKDIYQIYVQLKDKYLERYEKATEEAIGSFFAITYKGNILSSPIVQQKITEGRFTIEPFESREQAKKVLKLILGKDKK